MTTQQANNEALAQSRAEGADSMDGLATTRRTPSKVEPGSERHLTLMMAKYNLNFVSGKDRQDLLAWGRDVWDAAKAANSNLTSGAFTAPKPE